MDQQEHLMNADNGRSDAPNGGVTEAPIVEKSQNNMENAEKSYVFRWNYADQQAFDQKKKKQEKRRGAVTFAVIMALAFTVCIGLLVGLLIWNDNTVAPVAPASGSEIADVAESVIPGTVLIRATGRSTGYGSGFFVHSDGFIVTNYHVIEGARIIEVTLNSGQVLEATLIGSSAPDDLAVLKISGNNYPTLKIGDSDSLRVGDTLVAVGHPGGIEAPWTTTHGIVSALNREITVSGTTEVYDVTMIQTDAALNPGNSGGPVCNLNGEVVGIVARKLIESEGISLALPINGSMELVNAIIRDGNTDNVVSSISRARPYLGISGYDIREGETYTYNSRNHTSPVDGVLITAIDPNSGANNLDPGDIMTEIDGVAFTTMEQLKEILYQYRVGDTAKMTVMRQGTERHINITLGVLS